MLNTQHKQILHKIAYLSIKHGLDKGCELKLMLSDYEKVLLKQTATFVTLNTHNQLRGCIGILSPVRPLVVDVAHNAYAAAFEDKRFAPLTQDELEVLSIHISVLNMPTDIIFDSEQNLIDQLHQGSDGVILEENGKRATFLPSVWQQLDGKKTFIKHLKIKAGLPEDYWSDTIQVKRYTVESF